LGKGWKRSRKGNRYSQEVRIGFSTVNHPVADFLGKNPFF